MPDRLSHYVLLERLGTGGMGTVYRARDEVDGREVAVKVLHPYLSHDAEYVRRFEREARIAQSMDAPEVVRLIGDGREDDTYFLVMELVPGDTLADVIGKRGRLPVEEAVGIATSIARAMAAAHARGIIHRDISPQNVMITPSGQAKVMDFGVSRDLTQATMTATSMLMGKPYYIAPELVTSASRPDIRSDIYSLGIVLFEMLTGSLPFTAPTPYAVMQQHVTQVPPDVSQLRPEAPAWVVDVLERCLVKQPDGRFQTPIALLNALDGGNETMRVVRTPPASGPRPLEHTVPVGRRGRDIETLTPVGTGAGVPRPAPATGVSGVPTSATGNGALRMAPALVGAGILAAALIFAVLSLSQGSDKPPPGKGGDEEAVAPSAPVLLKASWVAPAEGQFLSSGAFTFQATLEPASLASTVSSLDLKVFWNSAWVTACYATPRPSGMFECNADVRAAEGPVALSYDVIFKDGSVKYAAAGQRTVSRPVSQVRVEPQPEPQPVAPPLPLPDRFNCSAIAGTAYRSEAEGAWYRANCAPTPTPRPVATATPLPQPTPTPVPTGGLPPGTYSVNRLIATNAGFSTTLTSIEIRSNGTAIANILFRNVSAGNNTGVHCPSRSDASTGEDYLEQGSNRIYSIDSWCNSRPGQNTVMNQGATHLEWSAFRLAGIDFTRPFTFSYANWGVLSNLVLSR